MSRGGYEGGYGQHPNSFNPQGSYMSDNPGGIRIENQSEVHSPPLQPGAQSPYSSNAPPAVGPGWNSNMPAQAPSGQYYSSPVQTTLYSNSQPEYTQQGQGYAQGPDYAEPVGGDRGQMEVDPGSMGQMDVSYGSYGGGGFEAETFDEEAPLLVELGIDLQLIRLKTLSVLNPMQQADPEAMKDTDLAGPLIFCLLFGVILLLSGKVHFGYIYGVGLLGCTSMYIVLNLMTTGGVSVGCVVSILGYCLLPMVLLSCLSIIVHMQGIVGTVLSLAIIAWCSFSASKLFVSVLTMHSMQLLIAYPCALLYGVFALLTIF